jgi:hypothetical protein
MIAKVIKDKYCRQFVFFEKQILQDHFIRHSFLSESVVFFKKKQNLAVLKNSCVFTQKSRIVFKHFKCSRNFLRDFGLGAFICNFTK